jgi:hypothetical protein
MRSLVVTVLALLLCESGPGSFARQGGQPGSVVRSSLLTIQTFDGKTLSLSADDLAALPHKSIVVFNAHSRRSETYSGIPLADLLVKVDVPLGGQLKGKLFLIGIVAGGTDGYEVLYSLAEVDPALHAGDVIVADALDGQKLGNDGAYKMVSTEDHRPARWVRNLSTISVIQAKLP